MWIDQELIDRACPPLNSMGGHSPSLIQASLGVKQMCKGLLSFWDGRSRIHDLAWLDSAPISAVRRMTVTTQTPSRARNAD